MNWLKQTNFTFLFGTILGFVLVAWASASLIGYANRINQQGQFAQRVDFAKIPLEVTIPTQATFNVSKVYGHGKSIIVQDDGPVRFKTNFTVYQTTKYGTLICDKKLDSGSPTRCFHE